MGSRTQKAPSRDAVREAVQKMTADEGVFLLDRQRDELLTSLTGPQLAALSECPWSGGHVVARDATIQGLWAKGLVLATGEITRAGIVLAQLLGAPE